MSRYFGRRVKVMRGSMEQSPGLPRRSIDLVPNRWLVVLGLLATLWGGCGGDSMPELDDESGTRPAVILTAQVVTPDDYLTYVAAFDDVPRGHMPLSRFFEFGNANVSVHSGYVFVEQDGVMRRFVVTDDLRLVEKGPKFSWTDFGIASANASYTVFVSATRAYTFAPELGVIVVWSPKTMSRTSVIEFEYPKRPVDMETWAFDGRLVGDQVIWNVFSGNFDTAAPYPAITLVIADAHSDAPPRFVEDDRCLPGGPSFVDDAGNYYVHGGGYFGYFYAYGGVPNARTCVLRVNAGESRTDPSFLLDYKALLGSYVSDPWYHVSGDQYVVRAWDPAVSFPKIWDEFWNNSALHPVLVDVASGHVSPYPELEGKVGVDGVTYEVDGVNYYQTTTTGYVAGGASEVVELRADGIHPRFQLDGFLQGLGRLR